MDNMFNKQNLWEIKKDTTTLFNIDTSIKEQLNTSNLDKIIKSGFNKTYTDEKWLEEFHCPFTDLKSHLQKIKAQIKNGFLVTKGQVSGGYGRASYKGNMAMALLPSEIRQALSIDTTKDYDAENCHPIVLFNLCKMQEIPLNEYTHLKDYCENRNDFLHKIWNNYFPNKPFCKSIMKILVISRCMFGGSIKTWRNEFKIDKDIKDSECLINLKAEVKKLCKKYVLANNSDIFGEIIVKQTKEYAQKMEWYEKNKKKNKKAIKPVKKNSEFTLMSLFLQNWERIIIETCILQLIKKGKIVKNRYIYTYDGFQTDADISCKDLEKIVKSKIGMDIIFTIKDCSDGIEVMNQCQTLLEEDMKNKEHPEHTLEIFNLPYFESLKYDFALARDYWEKFVCFTVKDGNYWFQNIETLKDPETGYLKKVRHTTPYKWSALLESFGDINTISYDTVKGEERIKEEPFLKKWKKEGMRKYYKMDFFPENKPHEERLKGDCFNTFTGYPDFLFEDSNYTEEDANLFKNVWEGVLSNLLGGEKAMLHFNMITGYKIKYPSKKKPFGIIIKGRQGEGKNFVLSRLAKVVSENHYLTTSNVKDVIGDYAMGLFHKLIVNLNEMDLTSTKSITNRFKSIISENTITFNPKHSNQFESINYALMIITSNENIPIVLDVMTGERRWFIFEGNGNNTKISQEKWGKIHKITESEKFVKWLYDYYMQMDVENFDFKKAKYENSKSDAYNKVASLFIPYEMLFLKDWILNYNYCNYIKGKSDVFEEKKSSLDDGYNSDDDNDEYTGIYYKEPEFYKLVEVEIKDLLRDYWDWSKRNKISLGELKKEKSFVSKIMSFNFRHMEKGNHSTSRRAVLKFKSCDILKQLIEKKAFDDDVEKWDKLNEKGEYVEDKNETLDFLDFI